MKGRDAITIERLVELFFFLEGGRGDTFRRRLRENDRRATKGRRALLRKRTAKGGKVLIGDRTWLEFEIYNDE